MMSVVLSSLLYGWFVITTAQEKDIQQMELDMIFAASNGDLARLRTYLEMGMNPDAKDEQGWSAVAMAVDQNQIESLKLLAQYTKNLNPDVTPSWGALQIAASKGFKIIAEFLLDSGIEVNLEDPNAWSPLFVATFENHTDLALMLIKRGADPNAHIFKHGYVLHIAVRQTRCVELVKAILEAGAPVDSTDLELNTPLIEAVKACNAEIIHLLINHSADVNFVGNGRWTPLHFAAKFGCNEAAELLLENGANVTAALVTKNTSLHIAASVGSTKVAETLIAYDAFVDAQDIEGFTALHLASNNGYVPILMLLLKQNASPEIASYSLGLQAIHVAAVNNQALAAKVLAEHGTSVSVLDARNNTPLQLAKPLYHVETAIWLHLPSDHALRYIGCFKNREDKSIQLQLNSQLSSFDARSCVLECTAQNFEYAGIEPETTAYGKTTGYFNCYCIKNMHSVLKTGYYTGCETSCPGNKSIACGGISRISVYASNQHVTTCPSKWLSFREFCYRVYDNALNMMAANRYCQHQTAFLASIDDEAENSFLAEIISLRSIGPVWIGLNDHIIETQLEWVNGAEVIYHGFPQYKLPQSYTQDCTLIQTTGNRLIWFLANCYERHAFVCKAVAYSISEKTPSEKNCNVAFVRNMHTTRRYHICIVVTCGLAALIGAVVIIVCLASKRRQHKLRDGQVSSRLHIFIQKLKTNFVEFCRETYIHGMKQLVQAKSWLSIILWGCILLPLLALLCLQTVQIVEQYYVQATRTEVSTKLHEVDDATFSSITLCARAIGGWAKTSSTHGNLNYDTSFDVRQYVAGYADPSSTNYTMLESKVVEDMLLLNISLRSDYYALVWGIQTDHGARFETTPFLTSMQGSGGPLICRLLTSQSCIPSGGCSFRLELDINWEIFHNVPGSKEFALFFSTYYTSDIAVTKRLLIDRNGLIPLQPFTPSENQSNLYTYTQRLGASNYTFLNKADRPCIRPPKHSVLPTWLPYTSCDCFDILTRTLNNCSYAAEYDATVALSYPLCQKHERWSHFNLPPCAEGDCHESCPNNIYCFGWSIQHHAIVKETQIQAGEQTAYIINIIPPAEIVMIEEKLLKPVEDILSDIGGTWALYLGCSVLSVAHIIWFLCNTLSAQKEEAETVEEAKATDTLAANNMLGNHSRTERLTPVDSERGISKSAR